MECTITQFNTTNCIGINPDIVFFFFQSNNTVRIQTELFRAYAVTGNFSQVASPYYIRFASLGAVERLPIVSNAIGRRNLLRV